MESISDAQGSLLPVETGLPASGLGGSYLAHKEPNDAKLGFQPSWVDVNRSLGTFRFSEGGCRVVGGWNLHTEVPPSAAPTTKHLDLILTFKVLRLP